MNEVKNMFSTKDSTKAILIVTSAMEKASRVDMEVYYHALGLYG